MPHQPDARLKPSAQTDRSGTDRFDLLFKAAYRPCWLVALGVVQDAALADDIVQEAALIALGKMSEFRPGSSFTAWMAKIVRYVALNQARARQRRRALTLDADPGAPHLPAARRSSADTLSFSTAAHVSADQPHFDDRVVAALRQLGDTARTCLLLRTLEEMDYAEISRMLRIPPGTAMSHVHRARKILHDVLSESRPAEAPPGAATA